jgi:hypothetical protein
VALDKKDRDEYFQKRDMIATKMIPAQIIEAQKLAREWKPTMQPPRYSPWMLGVQRQLRSLAGQEHGRTIPLTDIEQPDLPCRTI